MSQNQCEVTDEIIKIYLSANDEEKAMMRKVIAGEHVDGITANLNKDINEQLENGEQNDG